MDPRIDGQASQESQFPPIWFNIVLFVIFLFVLILGIIMSAFFIAERQKAIGENVGGSDGRTSTTDGSNTGTGSQSDCSGVASVPTDLLGYVKDASSKHLGGDEAALIALIQTESGWNVNAKNPGSSAAGLGQFTNATARDHKEYMGGKDKVGITWSAGVIYDEPAIHPDDARFDGKRAIYATANLLNVKIVQFGTLERAYIDGYHTHTNAAQLAEAQKGAARLMSYYNKLKSGGGCTSTSSLTGSDAETTNTNVGATIVTAARKYIGETTQTDSDGTNVFRCNAPTRSCASFVSTSLLDAKVITFHEKGAHALYERLGTTQTILAPGSKVDTSRMQPGDIVWFGPASHFVHVGIYAGNGRLIHTSSSQRKVVDADLATVANSLGGLIATKRFK